MSARKQGSGVISRDELYTVQQLKARLGISAAAFRELKQAGLRIIRLGQRVMLSGNQVIEFLEGNVARVQQG